MLLHNERGGNHEVFEGAFSRKGSGGRARAKEGAEKHERHIAAAKAAFDFAAGNAGTEVPAYQMRRFSAAFIKRLRRESDPWSWQTARG